MPQGKILSQVFKKEWKNDKGTFYSHAINIEGIGEGEINTKEQNPSWLKIGELIEVEVNDGQYGKKFKRVAPQKAFGGYKKPVVTVKEATRISKSNAVHAISVVNQTYNEERLSAACLGEISKFTMEGISGEFDKFGEIDQDFTSRLAAVNNAAIQAGYRNYETASDLINIANKIYKYVTA
jgi:hypothetical protein